MNQQGEPPLSDEEMERLHSAVDKAHVALMQAREGGNAVEIAMARERYWHSRSDEWSAEMALTGRSR